MQWILLGIVVLSLVVLARYHPKLGFGILFVLMAILVVVVTTTQNKGLWNRSQIEVAQIEIQNPVIEATYGGDYRLNIRLLNTHSNATLTELILSITMKDCPLNSDQNCVVVGQDEEIININIPPQQARDVSEILSFDSAKPVNDLRWDISVTRTRS